MQISSPGGIGPHKSDSRWQRATTRSSTGRRTRTASLGYPGGGPGSGLITPVIRGGGLHLVSTGNRHTGLSRGTRSLSNRSLFRVGPWLADSEVGSSVVSA